LAKRSKPSYLKGEKPLKTRILDTTSKKDVQLFKSLPFKLYRKNPLWVPPVPGEVEFAMDRTRHPFYAHSEADFIVVESGRDILGRIAVLHNKNYCEFHKVNTAFFFYYEAVDDQKVADLLFSAAEDWCRKRKIAELYGPRGLLRSDCIGMLVEGFDKQPATGMTYNMPYNPSQLAACGFEKFSDHFSGCLDQHLDRKIYDIAKKVLARGNFQVLNFKSTAEMEAWVPRIDEVHHRAFAENPGFIPSTPAEFDLLAHNILALADPRYMKLILHGNEIAGFIIAFPNLNRGLLFARSRMFPFGWLGLLLDKKFSNVIDLEAVGLLPEYQGLGGNAVLYAELDRVLTVPRFKHAEIVQVDERNVRSKSDMQTMGVVWDKTHRTYKKVIGE
jgi:hypothetical protein